jgi:hypothetical protein
LHVAGQLGALFHEACTLSSDAGAARVEVDSTVAEEFANDDLLRRSQPPCNSKYHGIRPPNLGF